MAAPDDPDLLAVLHPSAPRRAVGAAALGLLGLAMLWLGVAAEASAAWRAGIGAAGIAFALGGRALWRATGERIELRRGGLVTGDGRSLAALGEIAAVNRGTFAVKPSNGFLVRLRSRHGFAWAPGLYWRWGRALGIGGATSGAATRAMADILALRLAERERDGR